MYSVAQIVVLLLKHFYCACQWSLPLTSPGLDIFPGESWRNTESWRFFRENRKFFFVVCRPERFNMTKNTRPLNKIKTGVIYWGDKLVSLCLIWPVKHDTKCWLCQAASVKNLLHNRYNSDYPGSKKKKKAKTRVPKRNDMLKKIWRYEIETSWNC